MRLRDSLALVALFVVYMVLGSAVFMTLEYHESEEMGTELADTWKQFADSFLNEKTFNGSSPSSERKIEHLGSHCSNFSYYVPLLKQPGLSPRAKEALVSVIGEECRNWSEQEPRVVTTPWSFDESLYFTMTVLTTIGYGHLSPSTIGGQVFCIFYALFGVPLTGILLAASTDCFSSHLLTIYETQRDKHNNTTKALMVAALICLMPGIFVFILLPAFIFTGTEDWTYLEGVYYAFITLTTIGFGDFVTANNSEDSWLWVYRVAVILWIMLGLGYWFLIAGFITKGFQSKSLKHGWKHATDALTHHANEMKRIMLNLKTTEKNNEVISEQMKFAFQFIADIADSYEGKDFDELEENDLPSENENTTNTRPSGLLSLLQMPILHFAQENSKTANSDIELCNVPVTPTGKSAYDNLGTEVLDLKYNKETNEGDGKELITEIMTVPTVGDMLKVLASTMCDNPEKLSQKGSAKTSRSNTPKPARSNPSNSTVDKAEKKAIDQGKGQTKQAGKEADKTKQAHQSDHSDQEVKDAILALNENWNPKKKESRPVPSKASRKDSKAPLLP